MEAYRGLAILTTNLKDAIDPLYASHPVCGAVSVSRIWRSHQNLGADLSRQHTDRKPQLQEIGKAQHCGGQYSHIAMNAAFIAADENQPVQMRHLLKASQGEYMKLERSMTEAEIRGWVQEEQG